MALSEPSSSPVRVAGTVALLLALAGCQTRVELPTLPRPDAAPDALTPADAIRRIEWCWERRATEPCRDLFSCDFVFQFAPTDTAGNRFRDRPWTRPDEIDFVLNLFVRGSVLEPPASYVALQFDRDLVTLPDPRPGRNPKWHRSILTQLVLVVDNPAREYRVLGTERFFFVRGDSACLPQELRDRGYGPDSTRWWIERWEDESAVTLAPAYHAMPLRPVTLGTLKARYLDGALPAN